MRRKDIALGLEAESLVHEPRASPGVRFPGRAQGLVAEAGKFSAGEEHGKTELLRLDGAHVEENGLMPEDFPLLPVSHGHKKHAGTYVPRLLFADQHHDDGADDIKEFLVGADRKRAPVGASVDVLADGADHPDDAHDVIHMLVRHINGMDFIHGDTRLFKLDENAVAAAGVHEQAFPVSAEQKTRIVAAGHHGVAGAEHKKFHLPSSPEEKSSAKSYRLPLYT